MLAERLDLLKILAEEKAAPDFFCRNRENYGHANGLRRAVALLTGVEFQPLLTPAEWLDSGDKQSATIEELRADLETAKDRLRGEAERATRAFLTIMSAAEMITMQTARIETEVAAHVES